MLTPNAEHLTPPDDVLSHRAKRQALSVAMLVKKKPRTDRRFQSRWCITWGLGACLLGGATTVQEHIAYGADPVPVESTGTTASLTENKRSLGLLIDGDAYEPTRAAFLERVLLPTYRLADSGPLFLNLFNKGYRKGIGKALLHDGESKRLIKMIPRALTEVKLDAVVLLHGEKRRGGRVKLWGHMVTARGTVTPLAFPKDLPRERLGEELQQSFTAANVGAQPASAETRLDREPSRPVAVTFSPLPAPAQPPPPPPPKPLPPKTWPWLEVAGGVDVTQRKFSYQGPTSSILKPLNVGPIWSLALGASAYPLARTRWPVLAHVGVVAAYDQSLGLLTRNADNEFLPTSLSHLHLGLRFRTPFNRKNPDRPVLFWDAAYHTFRYEIAKKSVTRERLPMVFYRTLRFGVEVRYPIWKIIPFGGVGYQWVLTTGPLSNRFLADRAHGFDATLGTAVPLLARLEARVAVMYSLYLHSLKPNERFGYVATGATDQTLAVRAQLAYSF